MGSMPSSSIQLTHPSWLPFHTLHSDRFLPFLKIIIAKHRNPVCLWLAALSFDGLYRADLGNETESQTLTSTIFSLFLNKPSNFLPIAIVTFPKGRKFTLDLSFRSVYT